MEDGCDCSCRNSCNSRQRPKKAKAFCPVPDRLVVLTFDDGVKSQAVIAAPILKRYGFGATFFVTEAFKYNRQWKSENYLTWDHICKLHADGFEIANHTGHHNSASEQTREMFLEDLEYMEKRCVEHGLPAPKTFCYPGYKFTLTAVEVLAEKGYLFARRGCTPELPYVRDGQTGLAYDPAEDHPLLIPTTAASGPKCGYEDLVRAAGMATDGRICVLTFHGVPDSDHPWVHTDPAVFEKLIKYLGNNGYTVIALQPIARRVEASE